MSESEARLIHEWLGIPESEFAPSLYRLLGLAELEPDASVISFVSTWRMDFIRSRQTGAAADQAATILKRLQAAKLTLLNAQKKAEYDAQLRSDNPMLIEVPAASPDDGARRWLGLVVDPAGDLSDHQLLGVTDDETDLAVIKSQFDQRMSVLRNLEKALTGSEQQHAQQLVSKLALAHSRAQKSLVAVTSKPSQSEGDELPPAPPLRKTAPRAPIATGPVTRPDRQVSGASALDRLKAISSDLQGTKSYLPQLLLAVVGSFLAMGAVVAIGRWSMNPKVTPAPVVVADTLASETDPPAETEVSNVEVSPLPAAAISREPIRNPSFKDGFDGWEVLDGAVGFRRFKEAGQWAVTTFGDQQDRNTGRLRQSFSVPADAKTLSFDLHGGGSNKVFVSLSRGTTIIYRSLGRNSLQFFRVNWDVTALRNQNVTIEIVDNAVNRWGWIGVKNFQLDDGSATSPVATAATSPGTGPPVVKGDGSAEAASPAVGPAKTSPILNPTFADQLKGWQIDGDARRFKRSLVDGDWVLSSYGEFREQTVGSLNQAFVVPPWATTLEFSIAGGSDRRVSVLLVEGTISPGQRDAKVLKRESGRDSREFRLVQWSLVEFRGKTLSLMIGDGIRDHRWGWISVKNIQVTDRPSVLVEPEVTAEAPDGSLAQEIDEPASIPAKGNEQRPGLAQSWIENPTFSDGLSGWKIVNRGSNFRTFQEAGQWTLSTRGGPADLSTGALTQAFKVPLNAVGLNFQLNGGDDTRANVKLSQGNQVFERATGQSGKGWIEVSWDMTRYRGEELTITISDTSPGKDGFVEVRNFQLTFDESIPAE